VPATWPFEDGFAVLTRSLVLGLIVFLLVRVGLHALELPLADVWSMLVAPLPMLWLMQRGLLAPRLESFVRAFGLDSLPGAPWRWIALVLALFTANQLGAALIADLLGRMGIGTHWTETVDESLLHAKTLTFGALAFVTVAWLPVFQELFCRGILFLTLRARMPLTPAALWSAALVAAFSNLSPPGFLAWIWGGFTFALTFEKARSLLPLIACLALANALQCLAYQLLYR
jgi:membrane protease YdiL (CAAX protease family)